VNLSFAKTPSARQIVDLAPSSGHNRDSMITLLVHPLRLLPFLVGERRQLALESLALRYRLVGTVCLSPAAAPRPRDSLLRGPPAIDDELTAGHE